MYVSGQAERWLILQVNEPSKAGSQPLDKLWFKLEDKTVVKSQQGPLLSRFPM